VSQRLEGLVKAVERLRAAIALVAPPPLLKISEWANRFRRLSKRSSSAPGRFKWERAPYQREMMDAVCDPNVGEVVYMTSSQIGKTEILNNVVGYYIDQDPSPILVVLPTVEMAESWSKDRLTPMIEDSPALVGKVSVARSRDSDNTILHKGFPGGHLTAVGANAPGGLAMRPVRIVLGDEIDRFPPSAGTEGDPVSLASKRTMTYWNRKHLWTSTPTVKGLSRISDLFTISDQRRFHLACPHCGHRQPLRWSPVDGRGGLSWEGSADEAKPETAVYVCESEACGKKIEEKHKTAMLRGGVWVADRPGRKIRGYHLNALYSPWVSWAELVEEWYRAQKSPESRRVFVNTILGEVWDEPSETLEASALATRLEAWEGQVPNGVGVLTASVDVQGDRLEAKVKGWGADEESWLIAYSVIEGDPENAAVWFKLDALLGAEFLHQSGRKMKIERTFVDSGGHHTEQVYRYCGARANRGVFACKGGTISGKPLVGRPSTSNQYHVPLFVLCVDTGKEIVMSRLRLQLPKPPRPVAGFIHLPEWVDEEYLAQLTAERSLVKFVKGRGRVRVWEKLRDRNEALDLEVYALAALKVLGEPFIKGLADRAAELAKPPDAPAPATDRQTMLRQPRRPGGWMSF